MDLGAAVYLGTYRESIQTIRDVGLGNVLRELPAIGAMPKHGQLHEFDYSTPVRTALSTRALSPAAKLKAVKLAWTLAAEPQVPRLQRLHPDHRDRQRVDARVQPPRPLDRARAVRDRAARARDLGGRRRRVLQRADAVVDQEHARADRVEPRHRDGRAGQDDRRAGHDQGLAPGQHRHRPWRPHRGGPTRRPARQAITPSHSTAP